MKILSALQMRGCDERTFTEIGVAERAVVESAGRAVASWLTETLSAQIDNGVVVLAGPGHNGADGFVAARALLNLGIRVAVFSTEATVRSSEVWKECRRAFLNAGGQLVPLIDAAAFEAEVRSAGLVLDSLFGTGFTPPARPEQSRIIERLNQLKAESKFKVVSVDIPSGLSADSSEQGGSTVQADFTLAVQALKHCHVFPPAAALSGEVYVVDVGIDLRGVRNAPTLLRRQAVSGIVQRFFSTSDALHKGKRGHIALIGGASGHVGAIKLSGQGALKVGAGLSTIIVPEETAERISGELLELMCAKLPGNGMGGFSDPGPDAVDELLRDKLSMVIGPGLGTDDGALAVLLEAIRSAKALGITAVVDADALNLLSMNPELLQELNGNFVLTPHPGEMGRLLERSASAVNSARLAAAGELVERSSAVVVLKGCRSVIAAPNRAPFISPFCVQTLATAGSGDLLSGIIGGFLARGFPPFEAALAAVYLHGEAGELLLRSGPAGVVASDIGSAVGQVINLALADRPPAPAFARHALRAIKV